LSKLAFKMIIKYYYFFQLSLIKHIIKLIKLINLIDGKDKEVYRLFCISFHLVLNQSEFSVKTLCQTFAFIFADILVID
jgi:hypothetical protein